MKKKELREKVRQDINDLYELLQLLITDSKIKVAVFKRVSRLDHSIREYFDRDLGNKK